jgi:hypothetical protein
MKNLKLVIHPLMFTLYGVLALFSNNISQIGLAGLRAILLTFVVSISIILFVRLIIHDGVKAGLISSGIILLVFSYGHVQNITEKWSIGHTKIGNTLILTLLWFVIMIAWGNWVLRKGKNQEIISNYLNWVSIILIIFPIYQLVMYNSNSNAARMWKEEYMEYAWNEGGVLNIKTTVQAGSTGERPDIYYIVLDAYTRADFLKNYYHYDNFWFIKALQDRGFCIADKSQANYTDTEYSLASSLNMIHIFDAPEFMHEKANLNDAGIISNIATQLILKNRVADFLRKQGYTFVAFDNGYPIALPSEADQLLKAPGVDNLSNSKIMFEMMLLDTSLGRLYFRIFGKEFAPLQTLFENHREKVLYTLDTFPEYAVKSGDYFVYAHVLSPHTPYVFGSEGEKLQGVDPYTLLDYDPGNSENVRLYPNQLNYINKLTLQAIDKILSKSEIPPIIILQGDHGSRVFSGGEPTVSDRMLLMFPILNAYYLPGTHCDLVYSTITPVNTFRVIFNDYFNTQLKLLEDKGYWLQTIDRKVEFIDVCQEYGYCAP